MAEKVTIMVIKADLQCSSCYKKLKKLLCKFPEIRDQTYDVKQNTVTITVLSFCPERIRDKLCSKGGKIIICIEIKPPPKPKDTDKPKEPEKKPKEPEQKPPKEVPSAAKPPECAPIPVSNCPTFYPPCGPCFGPCCNGYGYGGGPCHQAYGRPVPWYDNYGYGPYGYCGNTGPYVSPCEYFRDENSSTCTIM